MAQPTKRTKEEVAADISDARTALSQADGKHVAAAYAERVALEEMDRIKGVLLTLREELNRPDSI